MTSYVSAAFVAIAAAFAASLALAQGDAAGGYPTKPIRFIVPYPAGGGADLSARVVAEKLAGAFKQPVIVENRPGANAIIGADAVAKAAPDGYVMGLFFTDHFINPSLYSPMPFHALNDFATVSMVGTNFLVVIADASIPAKSLQQLVALGKTRREELTFASWGDGSLPHLSAELLRVKAKIPLVHVPYKGSPPALADMAAGRISFMFNPVTSSLPFIRSDKLRALAVTSPERLPLLPDVPTVIEAGFPELEIQHWRGAYVPAQTPRAIINKLNAQLVKALAAPDVQERLRGAGVTPASSTPEQLEALSRSELERWTKVVQQAGVRTLRAN